ncbi:MAG: MarR family winged helix-turn-helix transcriptional regulator [Cyclobacteriaceae bacterium]
MEVDMKIEESIKQTKKFDNEYHKLIVNIKYRNGILSNKMQDLFKSHDITLQQYNILRILKGQLPKSVSINTIRDRMIDKNSDVSRLLNRLSVKDLIDKKTSATDRRHSEVTINENGLQLLNILDEKRQDVEKELIGSLSQEEAKILNDLLNKID